MVKSGFILAKRIGTKKQLVKEVASWHSPDGYPHEKQMGIAKRDIKFNLLKTGSWNITGQTVMTSVPKSFKEKIINVLNIPDGEHVDVVKTKAFVKGSKAYVAPDYFDIDEGL